MADGPTNTTKVLLEFHRKCQWQSKPTGLPSILKAFSQILRLFSTYTRVNLSYLCMCRLVGMCQFWAVIRCFPNITHVQWQVGSTVYCPHAVGEKSLPSKWLMTFQTPTGFNHRHLHTHTYNFYNRTCKYVCIGKFSNISSSLNSHSCLTLGKTFLHVYRSVYMCANVKIHRKLKTFQLKILEKRIPTHTHT